MDSGAVEHNGVGVDVVYACCNTRETSHNVSIKIDDQFHLGDGVWLRLLLFRFVRRVDIRMTKSEQLRARAEEFEAKAILQIESNRLVLKTDFGIFVESRPSRSRARKRGSFAVAASQMRAVLSDDAVTMRDPSRLK